MQLSSAMCTYEFLNQTSHVSFENKVVYLREGLVGYSGDLFPRVTQGVFKNGPFKINIRKGHLLGRATRKFGPLMLKYVFFLSCVNDGYFLSYIPVPYFCSIRYGIAFFLLLCNVIIMSQRVCLSLTMIAMVNSTEPHGLSNTSTKVLQDNIKVYQKSYTQS